VATRFYLPSSGAAPVSPAYGSQWEDTTNAGSRLQAVTTRINSAFATINVLETGGSNVNHRDLLGRQYVTDAIAAQTLSGTANGFVIGSENNAAANFLSNVVIRLVSNDGTTERAVLYAGSAATTNIGEWSTSLASRGFPATAETATAPITSTSSTAGDRIVLEFGVRAENTSTTNYQANFRFGDNSATDISAAGSATDNNTWFEFSMNITFGGAATTSFPFHVETPYRILSRR
jgi:hypothetical protein